MRIPTKIAIADDSPVIRRALRLFLQSSTDWQICGEVENGAAAVALVERLHPDLLILDLSMPVMNGLDAARKILSISPGKESFYLRRMRVSNFSQKREASALEPLFRKATLRW